MTPSVFKGELLRILVHCFKAESHIGDTWVSTVYQPLDTIEHRLIDEIRDLNDETSLMKHKW